MKSVREKLRHKWSTWKKNNKKQCPSKNHSRQKKRTWKRSSSWNDNSICQSQRETRFSIMGGPKRTDVMNNERAAPRYILMKFQEEKRMGDEKILEERPTNARRCWEWDGIQGCVGSKEGERWWLHGLREMYLHVQSCVQPNYPASGRAK